MKLKRIKLRGAIGLKAYGDEVEINFDKFDRGPISLTGPNGAGKSTILESLHPWPTLVSRNGSLTNHYYLRDSLKELEFEHDGQVYISKTLIDAENKKLETHLYCDGKPLNDGKTTSYKTMIEKLFGSPDIYFKSIFQSQNGSQISELRPGEKKEFFIGLLGLDQYQKYTDASKEKANKLQLDLSKLSGNIDLKKQQSDANQLKIDGGDVVANEVERLKKEIVEENTVLGAWKSSHEEIKQKENNRKSILDQVQKLEKDKTELEADHKDLREKMDDELERIDNDIIKHKGVIARLQKCIENAETIRNNVKRTEALSVELGELREVKSQIDSLNHDKGNIVFRIQRHKDNLENQITVLKKSINDSRKLASKLDSIPCNDTEYYESCPLIVTAREAINNIQTLSKHRAKLQVESGKPTPGESQLVEIEKQIAAIKYDREHHQRVIAELEKLKQDNWPDLLTELNKAETTIDERNRQIVSLGEQRIKSDIEYKQRIFAVNQKIISKGGEINNLKDQHTESLQPEIDRLSLQILEAETELTNLNKSLGEAQAKLTAIKELEAENILIKQQLDELQSQHKKMTTDLSDWILLERCCGKNHLQALLLDSACPQISSIATEMLQAFGREWSVNISTVRQSADGKKDIETFEIIVSTPAGPKNFDLFSGGERVWIEESIRKAITIYLINHSGREFKTLFQDEADGALDPDRAQAFLDTAFKAHEITGAHHTLIISQRPEIWRQIPQRIMLDPEKGIIETVIE